MKIVSMYLFAMCVLILMLSVFLGDLTIFLFQFSIISQQKNNSYVYKLAYMSLNDQITNSLFSYNFFLCEKKNYIAPFIYEMTYNNSCSYRKYTLNL